MQVQNLIDYFELLASTHSNIRSFGTGDLFEVAIAGEDEYPQLWLEQIFQVNESRGLTTWNVAFIIHSIQLHDETNENALLDNAFTIGQEIIQKIRNDKVYIVEDNFNTVSFTERFEDFTCGWRFELTLKNKSPLNICTLGNAFDMRCNYVASIGDLFTGFFTAIYTEDGALVLPTLPIDIRDTLGAATHAANLEDDMANLGFISTVSTQLVPGRFPYIIYTVSIEGSTTAFICLESNQGSEMFTASCDCFYIALPNEGTDGGLLKAINVDGAPLLLPSLPFDYSLSNPNFEVKRAALEADLIALGYDGTITDATPALATERTIEIKISNTADEFTTFDADGGSGDFNFNCN